MLDKINKKKNVNALSCVQKHDVIHTKHLHIVNQQGMKIGNDNPRISKIKEKNDYPNPIKQTFFYNDASNMFQDLARHEVVDDRQQNTLEKLFSLIQNGKSLSQFIDLLYNIKHKNNRDKQTKNICSLNQKDESDADPLVDLEIEGYHV